jgi:hypothetical protein
MAISVEDVPMESNIPVKFQTVDIAIPGKGCPYYFSQILSGFFRSVSDRNACHNRYRYQEQQ